MDAHVERPPGVTGKRPRIGADAGSAGFPGSARAAASAAPHRARTARPPALFRGAAGSSSAAEAAGATSDSLAFEAVAEELAAVGRDVADVDAPTSAQAELGDAKKYLFSLKFFNKKRLLEWAKTTATSTVFALVRLKMDPSRFEGIVLECHQNTNDSVVIVSHFMCAVVSGATADGEPVSRKVLEDLEFVLDTADIVKAVDTVGEEGALLTATMYTSLEVDGRVIEDGSVTGLVWESHGAETHLRWSQPFRDVEVVREMYPQLGSNIDNLYNGVHAPNVKFGVHVAKLRKCFETAHTASKTALVFVTLSTARAASASGLAAYGFAADSRVPDEGATHFRLHISIALPNSNVPLSYDVYHTMRPVQRSRPGGAAVAAVDAAAAAAAAAATTPSLAEAGHGAAFAAEFEACELSVAARRALPWRMLKKTSYHVRHIVAFLRACGAQNGRIMFNTNDALADDFTLCVDVGEKTNHVLFCGAFIADEDL